MRKAMLCAVLALFAVGAHATQQKTKQSNANGVSSIARENGLDLISSEESYLSAAKRRGGTDALCEAYTLGNEFDRQCISEKVTDCPLRKAKMGKCNLSAFFKKGRLVDYSVAFDADSEEMQSHLDRLTSKYGAPQMIKKNMMGDSSTWEVNGVKIEAHKMVGTNFYGVPFSSMVIQVRQPR